MFFVKVFISIIYSILAALLWLLLVSVVSYVISKSGGHNEWLEDIKYLFIGLVSVITFAITFIWLTYFEKYSNKGSKFRA